MPHGIRLDADGSPYIHNSDDLTFHTPWVPPVSGRLSLSSTLPVTTADVLAATNVYFHRFMGKYVPVYDGSKWVMAEIPASPITISLSGLTASRPHDLFAYYNAGALAFDAPLVWTSDTARATALVYQDGVLTKNGDPTRRYMGTVRTTGVTGQTEDSVQNGLLFNHYNRVLRAQQISSGTSHSYTTGSFRSWNNDAALRVTMMLGVQDQAVAVNLSSEQLTSSAGSLTITSVGTDSVTAESIGRVDNRNTSAIRAGLAGYSFPAEGFHYFQALELGGTGSTFNSITLTAFVWR